MTGEPDNIVLNILRAIQADIGVLKESVRRIDARMGAMENLMAGFHNTLNWHGQELDEHRGRLEALENDPTDEPGS